MSTPISDAVINVIVENEIAQAVDVTDLDVNIPVIDIVLGQQGPKGDPGPPGVSQPLPIYDECSDLTVWTKFSGSGTVTVQTVVDSAAGGKVFRAVGYLAHFVRTPLVPFDPTALYRMKVRVRQTVDLGPSTFAAGLEGVGSDGTTLVNVTGVNAHTTQHLVVALDASLTVAGGWQEFVGYVKGTAATGTGTACPIPSAPGKMHSNVRYIRPTLYTNYTGGTGTQEIDYVSLEIVPSDVVTADTAEIDFSGGTGGTPLTAALTGTRSGDWNVKTGNVIAGDPAAVDARYVSIAKKVATDAKEWRLGWYGDNAMLQSNKNGTQDAASASWTFEAGGQIVTWTYTPSTVGRPVPFATWANALTINTVIGSPSGSVAFTFPANRFSVAPSPVVTATLEANGNYFSYIMTGTVTQTGATAWMRHFDNANAVSVVAYKMHLMAIQMTPSAVAGLRVSAALPEGIREATVTCRSEDCENSGVPLVLRIPVEGVDAVVCGACGQPITDVEST